MVGVGRESFYEYAGSILVSGRRSGVGEMSHRREPRSVEGKVEVTCCFSSQPFACFVDPSDLAQQGGYGSAQHVDPRIVAGSV